MLKYFYPGRQWRRNEFESGGTLPAQSAGKKIFLVEPLHFFVHSRLDFCNSLYYGFPKTQLNRLQHIKNSFARAVVAAPRSSDADLILKSLHWLRVPERIEYKIASSTNKLLQHSSPQYLRDLITI